MKEAYIIKYYLVMQDGKLSINLLRILYGTSRKYSVQPIYQEIRIGALAHRNYITKQNKLCALTR